MVKKSRVLIITYNFPPDISAGAFRVDNIVRKLSNYENVTIDIITSTPNRYSTFKSSNKKNYFEQFDNINIYKIKSLFSSNNFIKEILTYINFFIRAVMISRKNNYNLIFATSSRLMTGFLGAFISKLIKKPLYLDIRDIFLDTIKYSNKIYYYSMFPIFNFMEKFMVNTAMHINIVSEGFETYFKQKYNINSLTIHSNGVDENFINYFENKKNKITANKIIQILYVGNIGDGQGLHKIIPSILERTNKKNIHFKIIGSGRKLSLLKKIISNKRIENCTFVNPIDRDLLMHEYEKASILFLHLNDYEAFYKVLPSKIFEYACTGKPILAGVNGYAKNFINKNIKNAKVFAPCDYNQAIKQISNIDFSYTDRVDFIRKYSRNEISDKIVINLLNIINHEKK